MRFLCDVTNPRNVVLCKKEIGRIDVSSPHERSGCFFTPAGVGSVDQPTLTLHEEMKITAGACQLLSKVLAADFEQFRRDAIGYSENLTEYVNQPLPAIQA